MVELVEWKQVREYIDKLAIELSNTTPSGIYGIPRGGLILAVILSHKLDIPLLLNPCKGCVIIDDIADTGNTLLHYTQEKKYYITTMFYHKQSSVVPDFWYKEKKDNWIVYPWEVN